MPQLDKLGRINAALKDRVLHSLSIVLTDTSYLAKSFSSVRSDGAYIIGNK
jgi:hypothetical protein